MRVLCIGDSLGLPREEVNYEDTWFFLLKQKYKEHKFIACFTRALLLPKTQPLFEQYYRFYKPDIVIWESGITDSAPRYIIDEKWGWKITIIIAKALGLEALFWKTIKKVFKRTPDCVSTKLPIFEKYAELLIQNLLSIGVEKIILMEIEPIGSIVRKKNPYWIYNIGRYNDVYRRLAEKYPNDIILISPKKDATDDCYIKDGYHPNEKGMKMTFDGIDSVLSTLL